MPPISKAGIQTSEDGNSYIPSSTRPDGSTRKEIRVRPGYRPPEDVEKYKNRSAEAWKTRGSGGVPGAESVEIPKDTSETKSKNAKRREAAKKKQDSELANTSDGDINTAMKQATISTSEKVDQKWGEPDQLAANIEPDTDDAEKQKKIRNQLKKLRAVRDLKEKKASGEKMSHDQLMKIGKEDELLRDLKKLGYDGPEMAPQSASNTAKQHPAG